MTRGRVLPIKVGDKFGKWTIVNDIERIKNSRHGKKWLCRCVCGRLSEIEGFYLVHGRSTQCRSCTKKVHGMINTPEYSVYRSALGRCRYRSNPKYKSYGGRGIKFLFKNFKEFYAELGPRPNSQMVLDRINNDGHYERGNIRWATRSTSQRNRRCSLQYQIEGTFEKWWAELPRTHQLKKGKLRKSVARECWNAGLKVGKEQTNE